MSTTKKTYSKEFKEEAVRLAKQTRKRSQVARKLEIQVSMLRRWQLELEKHQEKAFNKNVNYVVSLRLRRLASLRVSGEGQAGG